MLQDLAALTPPLIVCVAFLIGVGWFLRREMAPRQGVTSDDAGSGDEVSGAADVAEMKSIPAADHHVAEDATRR